MQSTPKNQKFPKVLSKAKSETHVESSQSDDVSDILDLWALIDEPGVDVDGDELVELDFLVLDVGLHVESWVNNLDFDYIFVLIFVSERFRNVDDDSP